MAARKSVSAALEEAADEVGEICGLCWPLGWPHLHHSASCEHGTWDRTPAAAEKGADPTGTPAAGEQNPPAE